jgi:hypothetical protein
MISEDSALPPDAVAYAPPAPPYVVLLASATICRLASTLDAVRTAAAPELHAQRRGAPGGVHRGVAAHARLARDDLDPVDVDVAAVGLPRFEGEERTDLPVDVLAERRHAGLGVAVPEDHEVEPLRRIAGDLDRYDLGVAGAGGVRGAGGRHEDR